MHLDLTIIVFVSIGFIIGAICEKKYINKLFKKNYSNEGWLPIETLPENERCFILTDGEEVDWEYRVDYNKKGYVIFGNQRKVATHWRRLPLPPKIH